MTVYLGFQSAEEYYRNDRVRWRHADLEPRVHCLDDAQTSPRAVREACERARVDWLGGTVHVLVGSARQERSLKTVKTHLVSKNLPVGSFADVAPGLAVATPACAFLQMASYASPVRLALFGNELAGTYAVNVRDGSTSLFKQPPVLTRDGLNEYLGACSSVRGLRRARRMATYVADGAASPMETVLMLLLCLPMSMGGYGFAMPRMNEPLAVDRATEHGLPFESLRPDLSWPGHGVALEYDSKNYHETYQQTEEDSARRALFASEGIQVLSVTKKQVYDANRLNDVALALAKAMGRRFRPNDARFPRARADLRAELLGPRR